MPHIGLPYVTHNKVEQSNFHSRIDPHTHSSRLSEIILGGQDGLVNVLGVILGVAAATHDPRIVLAAGMAAAFAESVSMGAVAYTSTLANNDLYNSEKEREYRHIRLVPELEAEEIRELYAAKGFKGETLDKIVEIITSNPDVWVKVMMSEEHQLRPPERQGGAIKSALVVGASAIIGSLIPLIPFALIPVQISMVVSIIVAATTLFAAGAYKARVTIGHPGKSGLEMTVIGTLSALVGYAVGLLFRVPAIQ
jgi:VIT1/CCC1 family predicted Fe2+/Mn2+ transporter